MFHYFSFPQTYQEGVMHPSIWPYVKRQLLQSLNQTILYYRKNPIYIKSDHILVRLLDNIQIYETADAYKFADDVSVNCNSTTNALSITSAFHKGRLFNGVFYGGLNPEIILSISDSFNAIEDEKRWWSVDSVKFIKTCKTDIGLHLPSGKKYSSESGLTIIGVDVARMALQYRSYMRYSRYRNIAFSTPIFIARFVIPNMLKSQLELNLINRIYKTYQDIDVTDIDIYVKHPFALINLDNHFNRAINQVCYNLRRSNPRFDTICQTMPSVGYTNAIDALRLPDMVETTQVDWAMALSRIDELMMLIEMTSASGANKQIITQCSRDVRNSQVDQVMKTVLPSDVYLTHNEKFNLLHEYAS